MNLTHIVIKRLKYITGAGLVALAGVFSYRDDGLSTSLDAVVDGFTPSAALADDQTGSTGSDGSDGSGGSDGGSDGGSGGSCSGGSCSS
jgi:hypothetical protein